VRPILVLGDERYRGGVATALEESAGATVVECDPAAGDCVMYVRLEGARYEAFVFVGYDEPVTRGALAAVAERAVLIPLLDGRARQSATPYDSYLFRLPRALGFRNLTERDATLRLFPGAASVASEVIGAALDDGAALSRLVAHATAGTWQWETFMARVSGEIGRSG